MISLTTARRIRGDTCVFCQFKIGRGRSAFATNANDDSTRTRDQPTLDLQKQQMRGLQYNLRHQLLLSTTSDAFKRKFNLKNFDDYWPSQRTERTKEFLKRFSHTELIDGNEADRVGEAVERAARDHISDLILLQLDSSKDAKELLRVFVVALQREVGVDCIRQHQSKMVSVLHKFWGDIEERRMSDSKRLSFIKTLNTIVLRLKKVDVVPDVKLLELAMLAAFQQGILLLVVSLLNEIQKQWNGPENRWRPSTELLDAAVYHGRFVSAHNFPGSDITKSDISELIVKTPEHPQQACLEDFVDQSQPDILLRWIRILALYGKRQKLWATWLEWQKQLRNDTTINIMNEGAKDQEQVEVETEFVKAFLGLNAHKEAWKIIEEADLGFGLLPVKCQDTLLDKLELANKIDYNVQNALLEKYERDLAKIEQALKVRWAPNDGGYHVAH